MVSLKFLDVFVLFAQQVELQVRNNRTSLAFTFEPLVPSTFDENRSTSCIA